MIHLDFPFRFDARGQTAARDEAGYVRRLVELLLFTSPGERVNRPEFGGGVRPLVFSPNGPALEAALKFSLQANLQRWLGQLILVQEVAVEAREATLTILVRYAVRRTGEERSERLVRSV
jgi:phage baseplate assembly protein W